MSVATVARSLFTLWPGLSGAETGGPPPRRQAGPVLMGDIHGALGGRPVLLVQWERWERDASDTDGTRKSGR